MNSGVNCLAKLLFVYAANQSLVALAQTSNNVVPSAQLAPFAQSTPWVEKPEAGQFYLVMNKSKNELSVRSFKDDRVLKIYRAISGTNQGDKERQGDKKTPEGIYFIEKRIPKSELASLHGAAAFALNYPNSIDRIFKRTGNGIWIHGVDNDERIKKSFDTRGCVAVSNSDVLDLGSVLTFRDIPMVIYDREIPDVKFGQEPADGPLHKRVQEWVEAWQSMDADRYLSFYSADFYSRKMNFEQWRKYKTRLAKQYSKIEVKIDDLKILRHGKYSVAIFDQDYKSNVYHARGRKRLYLIGEGPSAQILAEESIDFSVDVGVGTEPMSTPTNLELPPTERPGARRLSRKKSTIARQWH